MSSVFEQTYQAIEYIIIDGGSTDGSKEYIETQSPKVHFWVSEKDTGVYNAMNKGIKVATGEYVLFLNSGDHFYDHSALAKFQPFLSVKNSKDIIYGNIVVVSEKDWIKTYPDILSFSYFMKDTLPHPATLIKRSCFKNFLYDEDLKIVSDWKFFIIGICKRKFSYVYINELISYFYFDGISSTMPQIAAQEKKQVLKSHFSWRMLSKKIAIKIRRRIKK